MIIIVGLAFSVSVSVIQLAFLSFDKENTL